WWQSGRLLLCLFVLLSKKGFPNGADIGVGNLEPLTGCLSLNVGHAHGRLVGQAATDKSPFVGVGRFTVSWSVTPGRRGYRHRSVWSVARNHRQAWLVRRRCTERQKRLLKR